MRVNFSEPKSLMFVFFASETSA